MLLAVGNNNPKSGMWCYVSEGFAFASTILGQGFVRESVEFAGGDISFKTLIPAFCFKLGEPAAEFTQFLIRQCSNFGLEAFK